MRVWFSAILRMRCAAPGRTRAVGLEIFRRRQRALVDRLRLRVLDDLPGRAVRREVYCRAYSESAVRKSLPVTMKSEQAVRCERRGW